METKILSTHSPEAIQQALNTLSHGGILAFPTDTVYGLAARFDNENEIARLFAVKGRNFNKAIAVLVATLEQVQLISQGLTPAAARLAKRFWPGALTLVVPKRLELPPNLSLFATIGVRMPAHEFALSLLRITGPLATTSANISGKANPITAQDVYDQLNGKIDLILDGGSCPGGVPSTVVDCTSTPVRILRHGAITDEMITMAQE